MKARVLIAAVALAAAGCAREEPVKPAIEILEYGILEHGRMVLRPDDSSSVGAKGGRASVIRVAAQTDRVPLRPGIGYGVAFRLTGLQTEDARIRVVLRSSVACVLKSSGQIVYQNDSVINVKVGELRHIGARIPTSEAENHCTGAPQPGTYTFELHLGDRKLAEQGFHIYAER